ncbi:MAG: hypothetical protein IKY94_11720 [Lachnospiraceae bacterium]|nr:hypothetical protein [Lachnospiraceae bacterium]
MANVFILAIDRNKIAVNYDTVNEQMKRVFNSVQYMHGYLDGYLFGDYRLFTPSEFEKAQNKMMSCDKYVIFILQVIDESE